MTLTVVHSSGYRTGQICNSDKCDCTSRWKCCWPIWRTRMSYLSLQQQGRWDALITNHSIFIYIRDQSQKIQKSVVEEAIWDVTFNC